MKSMIGERVKNLRKAKKISQKEFANSIGLSQNHVSSIENGIRNITERTIRDICINYNVHRDWLIEGKGEMFNNLVEQYNIQDKDLEEMAKLFIQLDKDTRKNFLALMKQTISK